MLKRVVTVLSGSVLRLAFAAIAGLITAQLIGPEARGLLTVVIATATATAMVLGLGASSATTYLVGRRTWNAGDVVVTAGSMGLASTLASIPVVYLLGTYTTLLGPATPDTKWFIAVFCGLVVAHGVIVSGLNGLQRFGDAAIANLVVPVANVSVFGMCLAFGMSGAESALIGWGTGLLVGLLVGAQRMLRGHVLVWRIPPSTGPALRYGLRTVAGNIVNYANLRLDVFIIAGIVGLEATGQYSVAISVSEVLWAVPMAIGTVVFPEVAGGGKRGSGVWTARVSRIALLLTLLASILVLVGGWILFGVIMRHYSPALTVLVLLLPGTIGLTVARVLGNDLYGRGLPEWHIWAALASTTVTLVGDLLLITTYGINAAAAISTAAYTVYAAVIAVGFSRATGIGVRETIFPSWDDILSIRENSLYLVQRIRRVMHGRIS